MTPPSNQVTDQGRIKVGLALSGGGTRGLAHIGVLKVFEREGVPVDFLAGASMGGVIAAGYAVGMSPSDLEAEAKKLSRLRSVFRLADPGLPNAGLLRGDRLQAYFESKLGDHMFKDLGRPLALIAVDLNSREEVIFQEGSVALALRATTSVPGLFMPLETNGKRLVDGGVLNNLPVDVVRKMGADVVIAVDVDPDPEDIASGWQGQYRWMPDGLARTFVVLDEATSLMMRVIQEGRLQRDPPDVILQPQLPSGLNFFTGYNKTEELVRAGELAAELMLGEIRELL
ncbi:MAG: patatin-like phospholipase family protein [Chloroflexi bacterium]|nr:patatin-like phospholipase family protein [Chloroflexota bacterium]